MSEQWEVKTICGAAGGIGRDAKVDLQVKCKADTVEEVRCKVQAFPALFKACKAIVENWSFGDPEDRDEAYQMCSDAVKLAMGEKPVEVKACADCRRTDLELYFCPDEKMRCMECCGDAKYIF